MIDLPTIAPTANAVLQAQLQRKIDCKTKPLGALGRLEALALQLGMVQQSANPVLHQPQAIVFAADHGLSAEGVSAYPSVVTAQMVANMRAGGAAINVFARQFGFSLSLVNAGVANPIPDTPHGPDVAWHDQPLDSGSRNALHAQALGPALAQRAVLAGVVYAQALPGSVLAVGDMGIGNSSSAALLLARLGSVPIEHAVGRGTGLNDAQLRHKLAVLQQVLAKHPAQASAHMAEPPAYAQAWHALSCFGGIEIAMMTGAMLGAASQRRVVLVDGFIAGAAALVAARLQPAVLDYCVFSHQSAEHGSTALLMALGQRAWLDLGLRLGEGTGAVLAYPLLQAACAFLLDMATFESASVSTA